MDPNPLDPEPDDGLIRRLEALGPVLDELARNAADPTPLRIESTQRHRGRQDRILAAVAAILVVAAGVGVLAVVIGRHHRASPAVETNEPPGARHPDAALVEKLTSRRSAARRLCGAPPVEINRPRTSLDGVITKQVWGNPDCSMGFVHTRSLAEPALLPVHPTPTSSDVVGYWAVKVGWIPTAEVNAAGFDFDTWVLAAEQAFERPAD